MSSSINVKEQRMNKLLSNPNIDNILFNVENSFIWSEYIDLEKHIDEIIGVMNNHKSEVIYDDEDLPLIKSHRQSYRQSNHTFHIDKFRCGKFVDYAIVDENGYWHYVILNDAYDYSCAGGIGEILRSYKRDGDIIYLNKVHNIIYHLSLMKHNNFRPEFSKISINDNKELCFACSNCNCAYYAEQINSSLDVNKLRALIPFIREFAYGDYNDYDDRMYKRDLKIDRYESNEINFDEIGKLLSHAIIKYGKIADSQDEDVEFDRLSREISEEYAKTIYFDPIPLNDFIKDCEQLPGFNERTDERIN